MPKDYQEEYEPWHEDLQVLMEEYWEVWESTTDVRLRREQFYKLKEFVTSYGNARELQGVEKVEKGLPALIEGVNSDRDEVSYYTALAINQERQATLDHIAKVKSELK